MPLSDLKLGSTSLFYTDIFCPPLIITSDLLKIQATQFILVYQVVHFHSHCVTNSQICKSLLCVLFLMGKQKISYRRKLQVALGKKLLFTALVSQQRKSIKRFNYLKIAIQFVSLWES